MTCVMPAVVVEGYDVPAYDIGAHCISIFDKAIQ